MSDIRILGAGDETLMAAYFESAPDHTLIQRSNLARAGAAWNGQRYGGIFAASFEDGRISGVIAHYGTGFLAPLVQNECLKRGLILELGGRHGSVVRFLPPLIINAEQIDEVARRFARAMAAAVKRV